VIDAMTSIRPYRRPVRFDEAVDEVVAHAGTQFDPELAHLARATFLDSTVRV
jgi:HD-GYP domain-containing protein (c-di-GMP phosphodiesterase class II)